MRLYYPTHSLLAVTARMALMQIRLAVLLHRMSYRQPCTVRGRRHPRCFSVCSVGLFGKLKQTKLPILVVCCIQYRKQCLLLFYLALKTKSLVLIHNHPNRNNHYEGRRFDFVMLQRASVQSCWFVLGRSKDQFAVSGW